MKKTLIASLMLVALVLIFAGCAQVATTATSPEIVDVKDGESYEMIAAPVVKNINGNQYQMYAYNNMIPGPTLRVTQGSRITAEFTNNINSETTIHWHGLRQDVKSDGVPDVSQEAVQPGETFEYNLYFPDAGIYWYHPHVREDQQQDLGLAGAMIVQPREVIYNQVNREEIIMLDDILIERNQIVPFSEHANFALMGRYGNVMLVNGKTDYSLQAAQGDVIRFYVLNAANVRPFNLYIPGAKIKLVGSDLGLYEEEKYVDSVTIAPGERYIIEAYFDKEGEYNIMNINPMKAYTLGKVVVAGKTDNDYSMAFNALRDNGQTIDVSAYQNKQPDYTLRLAVDTAMMMGGRMGMGGMQQHRMADGSMMGGFDNTEPIEWEDTMSMMNRQATPDNTKWIIHDEKSGSENMDFAMTASIGDKVKIRIINDANSMHPMQHPMHLHGQRFVVLAIDGVPVKNQVWKDTVLVPIGSTVDVLVDVTNPGEWMFHCHIAEHLEAGMMSRFIVT